MSSGIIQVSAVLFFIPYHVLAEDDDEGEDLEEYGGGDGRQTRLLPHQVGVQRRLGLVVESQLNTKYGCERFLNIMDVGFD